MLKQSLNIIRNLIFNRHLNRTLTVPETASFSLTEAGSWTDLFGSSGFDSILKYYRSFAYSCINARAENVAKAEVYLYEQNGKKLKERIHHPFLDLMKSVNIYGQTFRDILYLTVVHLDLFGNAYGYIVRNRLNMPEEILLLNPERVRMEFSRDYSAFVYKYNDRGKEITYTSDEIIHFRLPDPLSNFKGKATISALVDTLLSDYYQSRYQSNFYRNDARPGFFLEYVIEL
jgi:HK97 family phage portal protein